MITISFDTGRVRHVDDLEQLLTELEALTAADAPLPDSMGFTSSHDLRISARNEAWHPEIVLLVELPEGDVAARLTSLEERLPRIGLAAVSKGRLTGDWALDI